MASRKLVRDLLFTKTPIFSHLRITAQQHSGNTILGLISTNALSRNRQFSVFNDLSQKIKGEANSNPEFKKSVEQLKKKAEELKVAKEDLKVRTKQTTEKLYKQADGVWTEAEATAKKVSANVKEKFSAATDEVKESFGKWKQESHKSSEASSKSSADEKQGTETTSGKEGHQQSGTSDAGETLFGKFKSSIAFASPAVSEAFKKIKEAKLIEIAKKGYGVLKEEISGTSGRRKQIQYEPSTAPTGERSTRTDITIVPIKQSRWGKKWETLKGKLQGNRVVKRITGLSDPVIIKSQEIDLGWEKGNNEAVAVLCPVVTMRQVAEDVRERWETSDNPVVHKIQDLNDTILGESDAAESLKEIRRRDPSFSLPDFLAEVQDIVKPVLYAYIKGDTETLKKYCSSEVIKRCNLERDAYQSQGIFFDNKILHISDAEIRETKMMGSSPLIIVAFQTQQVYCVRDKHGQIVEGSQDTIHTIFYAWAMQQIPPEEIGGGAMYPMWRLREMQQIGVQALI